MSPDNAPFSSVKVVVVFATTSILVGQTVGVLITGAATAGAATAGAGAATAGAGIVGGTTATAEFALGDNGMCGGRTAVAPPIGSGVGRGPYVQTRRIFLVSVGEMNGVPQLLVAWAVSLARRLRSVGPWPPFGPDIDAAH